MRALSQLKTRRYIEIDNVDLAIVVQPRFDQGIAAFHKVEEILICAAAGILDPDSPDDE